MSIALESERAGAGWGGGSGTARTDTGCPRLGVVEAAPHPHPISLGWKEEERSGEGSRKSEGWEPERGALALPK